MNGVGVYFSLGFDEVAAQVAPHAHGVDEGSVEVKCGGFHRFPFCYLRQSTSNAMSPLIKSFPFLKLMPMR